MMQWVVWVNLHRRKKLKLKLNPKAMLRLQAQTETENPRSNEKRKKKESEWIPSKKFGMNIRIGWETQALLNHRLSKVFFLNSLPIFPTEKIFVWHKCFAFLWPPWKLWVILKATSLELITSFIILGQWSPGKLFHLEVQWNNHGVRSSRWEWREDQRDKNDSNPHLFLRPSFGFR